MPVELAHEESGTGVPVVLLHGFPLSRAMFAAQVSGLADRARVVVPDLCGFGDSPGPGDREPSVDAMADDVASLLGRLDIGPAVVCGVSMGGYVAMAMLRHHPQQVGAVVLVDTKAGADDEAARDNRERIATAVVESGSRVLRPMLDNLLGQTTRAERPDVVATVTGWLDAARPDGVAWAQRAMAGRPSSFGTLAATQVPALVLVGEEDTLTPHDDALAMAAAFQRPAPVKVVPRAGHLSPVENPDAVTGALREVLGHF